MITTYPMGNETIFIALAAFDDLLLFDTIRSCINQAEYPHLLHFGVVHYSLDWMPLPDDLVDIPNIKYFNFLSSFGPGVGITRNLTYHLYDNETYYLQTDAHMYMFKHWDTKLVQMYKHLETKHSKFIISAYMNDFVLNNNNRPSIPSDRLQDFNIFFDAQQKEVQETKNVDIYWFNTKAKRSGWGWSDGLETQKIENVIEGLWYKESFFISGAFIFCKKEWVCDIEPDPALTFGEEPSLFIRLKTRDYKIFAPKFDVLWHYKSQKNIRNLKANFDLRLMKKCKDKVYGIYSGDITGHWGAKDFFTYQELFKNKWIKKRG